MEAVTERCPENSGSEVLHSGSSITQPTEYAKICLDRALNISWVLNLPGFQIWKGSECAKITQASK